MTFKTKLKALKLMAKAQIVRGSFSLLVWIYGEAVCSFNCKRSETKKIQKIGKG